MSVLPLCFCRWLSDENLSGLVYAYNGLEGGQSGQGRAGQGRAGQGRAGQATKREISDFLLGLIISHLLMAKSFFLIAALNINLAWGQCYKTLKLRFTPFGNKLTCMACHY